MADSRIPPPLPGYPVPKEYVRQQLDNLGIENVTEEDLESYAADLTQLIRDTLCTDTNVAGPKGPSEIPSRAPLSQVPDNVTTPAHFDPRSPVGQGTAVFKTFPGDRENRVHFLSPSPSPSPMRGLRSHGKENVHRGEERYPEPSPLSSLLSSVEVETTTRRKRVLVKRKVLRRKNGESRVFDESLSELESDAERPLARCLSDLSLTSVTSTNTASELPGSSRESQRISCCKSFIRPPIGHPHTRGLKKCDPVKRYHEFQKLWEDFKAPGERARYSLRWNIRERLLHQDVPYYEPPRRVLQPNKYVVPTDKKRYSTRWDVKHALAHQ